ncbi:NfeD family protein [Pseudogracilibacillus sp. SO10305]|uniref:NfeD family protein n=1 Tax=Pseudogracilibacillus sp. SO10305 TaxID=3098292 RepID=UPI00300E2FC5
MELIDITWIGLLLVGLGTFFLIGELLVNLRGLGAILGISFIVYYFYIFTPNTSTLIMMLFIYFVGIIFIFIDGKLINDGTLATIGITGMIFSVALSAPSFTSGLYAVIGVLVGSAVSLLLLKMFEKRNMWNKITLKDRLTADKGYTTVNEEYEQLIGKTGETITDMRPVGTIKVEGKEYSGISNAQWIPKASKIEVLDVDGTRILVKLISNEKEM